MNILVSQCSVSLARSSFKQTFSVKLTGLGGQIKEKTGEVILPSNKSSDVYIINV